MRFVMGLKQRSAAPSPTETHSAAHSSAAPDPVVALPLPKVGLGPQAASWLMVKQLQAFEQVVALNELNAAKALQLGRAALQRALDRRAPLFLNPDTYQWVVDNRPSHRVSRGADEDRHTEE